MDESTTHINNDDEKITEMKVKFSGLIEAIPLKVNSALMSPEKYKKLIEDVKLAKRKDRKVPKDFWLLKHYDVVQVNGIDKLISPMRTPTSTTKYYITSEELFEILHSVHVKVGHGGRDRMRNEIKAHYKNITCEHIMLFVQCCEICAQKKSGPKKDIVVKPPAIFNNFITRCQLNIIDLQTQPDEDYKFVFIYQDHLTKFVVLHPLKSKTADEIAYHLVRVFCTFGVPCVLQTDNGREFRQRVLEKLRVHWPALKIVHGEPQHSQSSQDVKNMLLSWMSENRSTKWSEGLPRVQFMKNTSFHSDIKKSPYEALVGSRPPEGILSLNLPEGTSSDLETEDELLNHLQSATSAVTSKSEPVDSPETPVGELMSEVPASEVKSESSEHCDVCQQPLMDDVCLLCAQERSMKRPREELRSCLEQRAKQIRLCSDDANFLDPVVGDNVRNTITAVDLGETDPLAILDCVLE